jgi:hypothetical protein
MPASPQKNYKQANSSRIKAKNGIFAPKTGIFTQKLAAKRHLYGFYLP